MNDEQTTTRGSPIRALTRAIAGAPDPQIMRIVALVDSMMQRGSADILIEPLRRRLATLRPARPLRLARLIFHPVDLLIVPSTRWRPGQQAIPRTALVPIAEHIRLTKGPALAAAEDEINGRTTADTELISRLGQSLWPEVARILTDTGIPETWDTTGLGDKNYGPLANALAALLAEAAPLYVLRAEAATGLLPPPREAIEAMLSRVTRVNKGALPMMIAVLLDQLPQAAELLPDLRGTEAEAVHAATEEAAELLLRHFDLEDAVETRIAAGTLADAGAAVSRIAALLKHLDAPGAEPRRRDRLRAVRRRLEADCKARFASGLQDELLAPLQRVGMPPADIPALEAAARGLRVMDTEARVVGSGSTYDLLLDQAAEAIKHNSMQDRLSRMDQIRLVEILSGPDAALAMLSQA